MDKYIDIDSGISRVRGNKTLYARMLNLFLNSPEMAKFDECITQNDYEGASAAAHAVKGVAGNLSLNPLFEISNELMLSLRQGTLDAEMLVSYRDILENTIKSAKAAIEELK